MTIDFVSLMPAVARKLWGEPNPLHSTKHELRWGTNGSRSVDVMRGLFYDHEADEGGGVLDLLAREGFKGPDGLKWLEDHGFINSIPHAPKWKAVAEYTYQDENGEPRMQVRRYEPKTFRQFRPDGRGGWIAGVKGVERVPYHLPELQEAVSLGRPIYIPEGEKDVETLRANGLDATCNAGGAGKWRDEFGKYFDGANVVILPDADDAGRNHADQVARSLNGTAASVRILEMPGVKDVTEWFTVAGNTAEAFNDLVAKAANGKTERKKLLLSSAAFVAGYVAPDYLIDEVMQKRFVYSFTSPSHKGKTALALRMPRMLDSPSCLAGLRSNKGEC